jgi:hypothetical protein
LSSVPAAAALQCDAYLYKHWREWQLTAYRVGRALKFRERDIEVWLERQRVGSVA